MKKTVCIIIVIFCFALMILACNFKREENILRFSSWGSQSEVKILEEVIEDFEKDNPEIKVEFIHIPQNYYQKLHLLFAADMAPDVLFINNQYIQMYIEAGLLENISDYFDKNEYISEALETFKDSKGNIYAIPRDISNLVLYYNKDVFKKHKVKIPESIKDIFQLRDIAIKVTDKTHWGINYEPDPLVWLYFLASNSAGVISDDKKEIIVQSDKSISALNLYKDFIHKYKIAPSKAQIGSKTTAQMFINSELAMYIGGRWMVPKFRQTADFKWDIIQFPAPNNSRLYSDASGWAISKKSKNKEAAVTFIRYLSSKKSIDEFTKSGLIIPARVDSFDDFISDKSNESPHNLKVYSRMLKVSKPTPVNKNYSVINDILKEKAQDIFDSNKNAQDVFNDKTVKQLESLL